MTLFPDGAQSAISEVTAQTTAMASTVTIRVTRRGTTSDELFNQAMEDALDVFHDMERICTRFVANSELMLLNASQNQWHVVPPVLYLAVEESYAAYVRTEGRFDPRVIDTLVALGYDHSLQFEDSENAPSGVLLPPTPREPWRLGQRPALGALHLGGAAIDLGGIGKGLAVRWASEVLSSVAEDFLVEAGGDCYCAGSAPEGDPWRVSVEDPLSGKIPVGVLEVRSRAVATSSIRLRRWCAGGVPVHHLIDPRTSRPGGEGLVAVTVVDLDPATAEVWSKSLFLEGAEGIEKAATKREVAALWVYDDGSLGVSELMSPYLIWRAS
jgi:thiamine biosynthesis lipoprotein